MKRLNVASTESCVIESPSCEPFSDSDSSVEKEVKSKKRKKNKKDKKDSKKKKKRKTEMIS